MTRARSVVVMAVAAASLVASLAAAQAQTVDLSALIPNGGVSATARILQMVAILTVLSVAPGLLIMVTSFTRFIVALSFLRSGLGLQSTPARRTGASAPLAVLLEA